MIVRSDLFGNNDEYTIKMKTRIVFFLMMVGTFNPLLSYAQNKYLNVQLDGVKYDSLFLFYSKKGMSDRLKIAGEKKDNVFRFTIPDSVHSSLPYFMLTPRSFNNENYTNCIANFLYINSTDTSVVAMFNFENDEQILHARYLDSIVHEKELFSIKINSKDSFVYGRTEIERFVLVDPISPDTKIRLSEPFYCSFWKKKDLSTYNELLEYYLSLSLKNPNSRYLITNVSSGLNKFKTRADVMRVFNNFSESNKKSIWGQKIKKYLAITHFENILLPNGMTRKMEPIIQDSSKFNLIAFSASWCGPCHRQIPLLKEVYKDLKGKLDITYISLDEKETINNWKELMNKEQIPWRSLLAANDLKAIADRYFVKDIPHLTLVHPNGEMEVMDLSVDKERLYSIVRKVQ